MRIISHTNIETLLDEFLKDVLNAENFDDQFSKNAFLTGANAIVCESKGLQEYLKKRCVDKHGIWAFSFRSLVGLLVQFSYNLQGKREDEKDNFFSKNNLVWAIYSLLKGEEKTFAFACEIAALFAAYQIYRPNLIEAWNKNAPFNGQNNGKTINIDENFIENEKEQRNYWRKLKEKCQNEQDISQLYKIIEEKQSKITPKNIFIFAPMSLAPVHLKTLKILTQNGCSVNLYAHLISNRYIGEAKSDKSIANLRKKSWEDGKIADEKNLYWDLGNRLVANLGRSAQVLYEQMDWDNLDFCDDDDIKADTLLGKIQESVLADENNEARLEKSENDNSITLNSCFSTLREIEVLRDYIIDLFANDEKLSAEDIAVVSPNIENYASAIDVVFGKDDNGKISVKTADRDVKKYDKTVQLFNLLFSQIGGRYEAPDIVALFEYSSFAQGKALEPNSRNLLEKWVRENAVRHGLKGGKKLPDYSFESGFKQLAAGFFMIGEDGFSEIGEYCYPDIEGLNAEILGDFVNFVNAVIKLDVACFENGKETEKTINDWDEFLRDNMPSFFGADVVNYREDVDNPYQKIMKKWDELKEEMRRGFGKKSENMLVGFSVLKSALLRKMEESATNSYSLSGKISFSNIETMRGVPRKIICLIGMNGKEFPRQNMNKEISLMAAKYRQDGDPDTANEDRLMFLQAVCNAKEKLYISWVGQSEKTAEDLDPSSVVAIFLDNLRKQYGIDTNNLVVKHPLQPFSKKYFDKSDKRLKTYDGRWDNERPKHPKSIWTWEIAPNEDENDDEKKDETGKNQEKNGDELYDILSNAPKYFLTKTCNIKLPDDIEILESTEPFVVESELEKWKLRKNFLKDEDKKNIQKLRGELPSGNFADKIIENIENDVAELKSAAKNEILGYPSNDKGRYRLRHWLYHLHLNSQEENQTTKMFLKNATIELSGMEKAKAQDYFGKLWILAEELNSRLLPIFPDAAWEYLYGKGLSAVWEKILKSCPYAEMATESATSLAELGIEEEFKAFSEKLFKDYEKYEVKEK